MASFMWEENMFIIKLGGSIITDKSKEYFFRKDVMDRLSSEIAKADKEYILVHGAGSFGHIIAKKYRLNEGYKDESQLHGFSLTHMMVQKLNTMVLDSLLERGVAAVSIPPHVVLKLDNHKPSAMDHKVFKNYLKKGFTPVGFGDVVLDESLGFSICSGDLLVEMFADYFKPEKVVFVFDEDGLYTSNPKIDENAKFIEKATIDELSRLTTGSNRYADVTKGMEGKIETIQNISKSGVDTVLLNGNIDNRLFDILIGRETKHTLVYGERE